MLPLQADDFSKLSFNIGGSVGTPLNPTAQYVGISGDFVAGAGYNIDKHNWIIGEFMWSGLPPGLRVLHPINAPFGNVNLCTLTANYRHGFNRFGHSPFGAYLIGGGGWGYACDPSGLVYTAAVAFKCVSSGGQRRRGIHHPAQRFELEILRGVPLSLRVEQPSSDDFGPGHVRDSLQLTAVQII